MKTNLRTLAIYRKLRSSPVSCPVGRDAEMALSDARTIAAFRDAEAAGLVRISCEDEQENYFDVYGKRDTAADQKRMEETLRRLGCYYVQTEWFDGEGWQHADGIGMCVYERPDSPFENCYVSGLMRAALDAVDAHATAQRKDLCLAMGEAESLTAVSA